MLIGRWITPHKQTLKVDYCDENLIYGSISFNNHEAPDNQTIHFNGIVNSQADKVEFSCLGNEEANFKECIFYGQCNLSCETLQINMLPLSNHKGASLKNLKLEFSKSFHEYAGYQ